MRRAKKDHCSNQRGLWLAECVPEGDLPPWPGTGYGGRDEPSAGLGGFAAVLSAACAGSASRSPRRAFEVGCL